MPVPDLTLVRVFDTHRGHAWPYHTIYLLMWCMKILVATICHANFSSIAAPKAQITFLYFRNDNKYVLYYNQRLSKYHQQMSDYSHVEKIIGWHV